MLRFLWVSSLLIMSLTGCLRLSDGKPPGPWYEAYEPIDDPQSDTFVISALEHACTQFGAPAIPVNTVLLRRSRKVASAWRFKIGEGFSHTECADAAAGLFVIYLEVGPNHPNYFPLLGHECAHLLDPYIRDWYMEGVATVFSEDICKELGLKWGTWKRRYEQASREPYGLSYRMMLELREAFPNEYPAIVRCSAANESGADRRHIDIDAWMVTLPPARRAVALEIISRYAEILEKKASEQYHFSRPSGLGSAGENRSD